MRLHYDIAIHLSGCPILLGWDCITTLGDFPNNVLWYLTLEKGNIIPHPLKYFIFEIIWRPRVGDAEPLSNF